MVGVQDLVSFAEMRGCSGPAGCAWVCSASGTCFGIGRCEDLDRFSDIHCHPGFSGTKEGCMPLFSSAAVLRLVHSMAVVPIISRVWAHFSSVVNWLPTPSSTYAQPALMPWLDDIAIWP